MWTTLCPNQWVWILPMGLDCQWVWIWKPHGPDSLLYHVIYTQPLHNDEDHTAIKQIQTQNIQDNIDLTRQTLPTLPKACHTIPTVIEDHQPVDMTDIFPVFVYWAWYTPRTFNWRLADMYLIKRSLIKS